MTKDKLTEKQKSNAMAENFAIQFGEYDDKRKLTKDYHFLLHIVDRSRSYIEGNPLRTKKMDKGLLEYLREQWKKIDEEFKND